MLVVVVGAAVVVVVIGAVVVVEETATVDGVDDARASGSLPQPAAATAASRRSASGVRRRRTLLDGTDRVGQRVRVRSGSGLTLLRANRPFRALWLARSTSYLGDAMGLVALLLHVAGEHGEAGAVAALLLVGDFVPSLLGPVLGTVGDRFDVRRVLVACELAQATLMAALALWLPSSLPLLLVVVGVRAVAGQVFLPASRAVVPSLVDDADLEGANAAVGLGANGMEAVGPLAAAALIPLVGVRGVLAVDAATFVVSALLLLRLPVRDAPIEHEASFLADAREGLRFLRSARLVRAVALGFVGVALCTGVDDVALVFLARDELGGGEAATAALYAAVGVGLLVGFGLLGRRRLPPAASVAIAGFALASGGNLLTGLAWSVGAAFAFQALRGIGNASIDVGVSTVIQREVPAALRSRVFGTVFGGVGVAAAGSYLLGALLLDVTDARTTFVVAGAGGLVAAMLTAVAVRRA